MPLPDDLNSRDHAAFAQVGNYTIRRVGLFDSAGVQIDSFGGGVEYTEGDTDASFTGKMMMWEDTSDTARVVSAAKPLPVDVKNTSIAVTGTFWQATQPVSLTSTTITGLVAVTGTFWQATQPVSAASLPLPSGAATSAKQDDIITAIGAIPGGGGVQYTEGDTDASVTGTAMMWEDTSDTMRAVSAAKPLPVDVKNASLAVTGTFWQATQPVSGTVTVTATNLDIRDLTSASDSVAAVQSGTWNITNISGTISLPTGAATAAKQPALGTAGTASTDVITVQGIASMTALKVDGSGVTQPVSGTFWQATQPVSNAGTFAVQVDGNALTALQLLDDPVFADDAAFTLSTSKVHVIGGVAVETDGTDPTSVAEGDAAAPRTDRNRRLLVNENHPNSWVVAEDHSSAQTNNQLKAAPGASLSLYITDVIVSNGATAGSFKLVEDEGGTPVQIGGTKYFAINGGMALHFKTPHRLTANKSLGFTSTTVTTHSVEVHGYIAP
jgi:hypothetical protein